MELYWLPDSELAETAAVTAVPKAVGAPGSAAAAAKAKLASLKVGRSKGGRQAAAAAGPAAADPAALGPSADVRFGLPSSVVVHSVLSSLCGPLGPDAGGGALQYFSAYENMAVHELMLKDRPRTETYR